MTLEKHSFWSKTTITTLSVLLLSMMIMAGVFFTTAFLMIHAQVDTIETFWQGYIEQSHLQQDAQAQTMSASLANIKQLTLIFIVAVLLAVGAFFALMYATLIGKIVRPLQAMQKGITQVSETNDFSITLPIRYRDEVGRVICNFNHLTKNLKMVFDETNAGLEKVARGEFNQTINVKVGGDLLTLKDNVNASIHSVSTTMSSLEDIANAIAAGNFSERLNPEVQGVIKEKIDFAMSSIEAIIAQINQVMKQVSVADYRHRVDVQANGQLADLKNYTNHALDALCIGIDSLNQSIGNLAKGNLTYQIQTVCKGEMATLKNNLNESTVQLHRAIQMVLETSHLVSSEVEFISEGNFALAQRTQNQVESIEGTASALEQMTSSVQQAADNARKANVLTEETMTLTEQGREVMLESVKSMDRIQASSVRISDIVGLIDSIAFQTNLLALNAAVEAARAGDHGRGFAVVASEVRNLASKSSNAAQDIRKLIDQVVQQVNQGATQLNNTHKAFERIDQSIHTVNDIMADISNSTQEQATGIRELNSAINELDDGIQQNSHLVQETTENSNNLKAQSLKLVGEVSQFTVNSLMISER